MCWCKRIECEQKQTREKKREWKNYIKNEAEQMYVDWRPLNNKDEIEPKKKKQSATTSE